MRGGNYRRVGEQLERLDRETREWHPCDESGVLLSNGVESEAETVSVSDSESSIAEEGE